MTAVPTNNLLNQINSAWPKERWLGFNVLVAVSGGADSVALLKALAEIRKTSGSDASGLLSSRISIIAYEVKNLTVTPNSSGILLENLSLSFMQVLRSPQLRTRPAAKTICAISDTIFCKTWLAKGTVDTS